MRIGLNKSMAARLLAAGLVVPLLGTATACRSADPESRGTPKASAGSTPSASAPSTTVPSTSAPSTSANASPSVGGTATGESPSAAPDGEEPVPEEQSPQPAPEPTFNAAEDVFLEGKVPAGVDPNAVLQVGQERCDVLLNAKTSDPGAVVSELIMNPSAEATDAIRSLCTDLLPELEAAALGFPDGVFTVGAHAPHAEQPSIAPGSYRAYAGVDGCSISIYAGSGALLGEYDASAPVTVGPDAARVDSSGCYSWFRS
ncbi:hypothetical protein GD627_13265 [Arthrobacter yangruifuii]|uniref:Lipoprotein n=1 Tax=Arthrobacter yangruifuii TaxID=2606616 RepID=A0A5N6MG11_9MICC|nr:hypothetical protein [Arthrobacter yangruifuii]KAD3515244.1 hypothetical protein GD627_13265 [Arthrobacter yangruifuii]